jgi:hypothetical protein
LCNWLRRIARGTADTPPPASILLLGGDVHCSSVSEIDLGANGSCSVRQIVCSPFRNPLSANERRVVKATGSRIAEKIFFLLAKLATVDSPSATWRPLRPATFENTLAELVLDGRAGSVTIWRSPREGEDVERLVVDQRTMLT